MTERDGTLLQSVERYYTGRLREYGATARGVDWNSAESQELRFRQLERLWEADSGAISILDYGCGYGALVDHLARRSATFRYQGFDISTEMIAEARRSGRATDTREFTATPAELRKADYVVASGVFNVKLGTDDESWRAYMRQTVDEISALASRGFAFNALTSYSDADRRRDDLHYADPLYWFDYCKRRHSRFVTLLHDYPLYEFTLLIRHPA